jgi:hypothetical protein
MPHGVAQVVSLSQAAWQGAAAATAHIAMYRLSYYKAIAANIRRNQLETKIPPTWAHLYRLSASTSTLTTLLTILIQTIGRYGEYVDPNMTRYFRYIVPKTLCNRMV